MMALKKNMNIQDPRGLMLINLKKNIVITFFNFRINFKTGVSLQAWDDIKEKMKNTFTNWQLQVSLRPSPINIEL